MKKILVPTDFSPCAENAVAVALEIAAKAGAEIAFLHLFADKSGPLHVPQAKISSPKQDAEYGTAQSSLDALVKRAEGKKISAKPLLVRNTGNDKIENYLAPLQIDLVVMGSHGATGIREFIIGSNTQRVVKNASAPVLVIKHKPKKMAFENILFASTFRGDDFRMLPILVKLASLWTASIHMLHINADTGPDYFAEAQEKMRAIEKTFPDINFTHNSITTNDPEWGIKQAAKDIHPDMYALGTEIKSGGLLFSYQLAEALVNHEALPVLVINSKN